MEQEIKLKIPYSPTEKQRKFHNSKAKFRAAITGVGFGKSAMLVNEVIKEAVTHPGTLNLIFGPTFPMVKNTTMREFWKFCPREIVADHNRTEHLITFRNGSQIIYLSGDNERDIDRLRGLTLGSAAGDEVAICPKYVHDIITARLRDPKGSLRAFYCTTPKGMNWLYELFIEKKGILNPQDYTVVTGSSYDNPHTPKEYKDTLTSTYTGVFAKQEILGEFVSAEGLVYLEFSREKHIVKPTSDFVQFVNVIIGIDVGYTNPCAVLDIGVDSDGRMTVIKELYQPGLLTEDLVKYIASRRQHYAKYFAYAVGDPSEPAVIQALNNAGVRTIAGKNAVIEGIQEVKSRLATQKDGKPRLLVCGNCVNTIKEFEQYRYPDKKDNKAAMEEPLKLFDHALDAGRYVAMSLKLQRYVPHISGR